MDSHFSFCKYLLFSMILITFLVSCSMPNQTDRITINDISNDSSYLLDCRLIYGIKYKSQVCLNNLCPGLINQDQILNLYKTPISQYSYGSETYLRYPEFGVRITDSHILASVDVFNDTSLFKVFKEQLSMFGCPDLMIAIDSSEEPNGDYFRLGVFYTKSGLEFIFSKIPIELVDSPEEVVLFTPIDVIDFYTVFPYFDDISSSKIINWKDAVVD
jgi:hypothetical protein